MAGPVLEAAPSPNHGPRTGEGGVSMLVLHYTGMPSEEGAIAWLRSPESQVSCHYVVREDGRILALVPEDRRAWHAGRSAWRGITDVNSRSIGIEICNPGHEFGYRPFPEVQIGAVIGLCRDVLGRHAIAGRDIVAHSDIAPSRKEDPGELFPWDRLAAAGIGHHVPAAPIAGGRFFQEGDEGPPVEALQAMFGLYGYEVPVTGRYCAATQKVVTAFQRHFRQDRVDGVADASTIATLHRLIAALPRGEA